MALIHCSECGREISDRAASCPGCGAPVGASTVSESTAVVQSSAAPVVGFVAVALGVAGAVMPYFAAVFLVPAAFVCGIIAYRRGQRGWGAAGIALALLGLIGIVTVSQQISKAQSDLQRSLDDLKLK